MLMEIINNLTKEQRMQLHIAGIPSQLVSTWRTGKRRPTFAQCVSLAQITGCDLQKLLVEVALGDATPEQKKIFAHLNKGVVKPIFLILLAVFTTVCLSALSSKTRMNTSVESFSKQSTSYIMSEV